MKLFNTYGSHGITGSPVENSLPCNLRLLSSENTPGDGHCQNGLRDDSHTHLRRKDPKLCGLGRQCPHGNWLSLSLLRSVLYNKKSNSTLNVLLTLVAHVR